MIYSHNRRRFPFGMIFFSIWMNVNVFFVKTQDFVASEREECTAETCSTSDAVVVEDCHDLHELCHGWAAAGECVINPNYMRSACRRSCALCYDERYLPDIDSNKELIRRIQIYSKMDIGENQYIPREPQKDRERVLTVLKAMDTYSKVYVTQPDMDSYRHLCTNRDTQCALWASQNQCTANNRHMLSMCPLACQMCHALPMFTRCSDSVTTENKDTHAIPSESTFYNSSSLIHHALSEDGNGGKGVIVWNGSMDEPWVVLFHEFLSESSCNALLNSLLDHKLLDWSVREDPPHDRYHHHRYYRAKCNRLCEDDSSYRQVTDTISATFGVPTSHVSFMDMIKLGLGDSIGVKHDLKPQHTWLPAGPRVLTLLLCLAESDAGGAVGFPDLDWTFVKLKKGQMLVWSNLLESDPTRKQPKMMNEVLPVVAGEAIYAKFYVHASNWKKEYERGCA